MLTLLRKGYVFILMALMALAASIVLTAPVGASGGASEIGRAHV